MLKTSQDMTRRSEEYNSFDHFVCIVYLRILGSILILLNNASFKFYLIVYERFEIKIKRKLQRTISSTTCNRIIRDRNVTDVLAL